MNQDRTDDLLLDKFDISLLAALQNNAHATNQEVGERIHLSASQVSRRIQRLEGLGLIRRYVALLDPAAVGLGVLSDQVLRRLMRIKGVSNIRSNIVLGCIKSTTELPLGHIGRPDVRSRRLRVATP